MARINIQIERMILKDLDLTPAELRLVQAAFEKELSNLIAANTNALQMQDNIMLSRLSGVTMKLKNNKDVTDLGRQIAHAFFQTIGSEASRKRLRGTRSVAPSSETTRDHQQLKRGLR